MKKSRSLIFALQCCVSLLLIALLLFKSDFAPLTSGLRHINGWLMCCAVLQLGFQPLLGALRWMLAIRALDGQIRFWTTVRFVWIGLFFTQVLPGAVGGDVVRMWLLRREGISKRICFDSVALERAAMLLGLIVLIVALSPELGARVRLNSVTWLPVIVLVLAMGGIAFLACAERLTARFGRSMLMRALACLSADTRKIFGSPATAGGLLLNAVMAYFNMSIAVWLIALALNLPVSLADCCVLVPVAVLASTIPISIGGWGVREGTMVGLFGGIGLPAADALTLSVLFGLAGIAVSLPGAGLWLRTGYRRADVATAPEMP